MTTLDMLYSRSQAMQLLKKQERGEHPLSYFCKICSKRFVSGRALGGHMRVHVSASMAADTLTETEFQKSKKPRASADKSMEEKDEEEGFYGNGSNLMYALRRNPKRSWRFADWEDSFLWGHGLDSNPIDSSLNSDLRGKELSSWKGHSETHQDSGDAHIEESHKHETEDEEEEDMAANSEEEDMAMCLVMLASGLNTAQHPPFQSGTTEPEAGDLKLPNNGSQLPKCIRKKPKYKKIDGDAGLYDDDEVKKARYKCTTCNKVFHSHQALGGHRSSHSKVKGYFSQIEVQEKEGLEEEITDEDLNTGSDSQLPRNFHKSSLEERIKEFCVKVRDETRTVEHAAFSGKTTVRVHECSICHRVFASGQALGGHKRCHLGSAGASGTTSSNKEMPVQQQIPARVELLDLNLPALVDDDCDAGNLNNLDGNAVDSHGASYAQPQSPPYLQSSFVGMRYRKQRLLLYKKKNQSSKDDEGDGKIGKEIRFGRGCDSNPHSEHNPGCNCNAGNCL